MHFKFLLEDAILAKYSSEINIMMSNAIEVVTDALCGFVQMSLYEVVHLAIMSCVYGVVGFWLFLAICPTFFVLFLFWPLSLYHRLIAKPLSKTKRKIRLRKVLCDPSKLAEYETHNAFLSEMNKVGDLGIIPIDYAVMKYVGQQVPLVVQQEYNHATNNLKTKKEYAKKDSMRRWSWWFFLQDLIFLRTPAKLAIGLCMQVETQSPVFLAGMVKAFNGQLSNMLIYHALEECEHAAVTVHNLRKQTDLFHIWLGGLLKAVQDGLQFFYLPIAVAIGQPRLLLNPFKFVGDWLELMTTMMGIFSTLDDAQAQIWHPQPLEPARYERIMKEVEKVFLERDIAFEITEEAEYEIEVCENQKSK